MALVSFRALFCCGRRRESVRCDCHLAERCLSEPGVEAPSAAAVAAVVSASAATTPSPCLQPPSLLQQKRRLSLSRSFSDEAAERTPATPAPSPSVPSIPSSSPDPAPPPPPDPGLLQPPKVYTILSDERDYGPPSPSPPPPSRSASARTSPAAGCSHGGGGHSKENKGRRHLRWLHAISRGSHFSGSSGGSSSAGSSRDGGGGGGSSVRERDSLECPACENLGVFKHSFDLEQEKAEQEALSSKKKLERMYSMDRISDDIECRSWFPSESMHMLHSTASTLQAIAAFRGYAERKRRKRELDPSAMVQRNFHKHLRMVGRHRGRAAVSLDRQESRECGRALPLSDVSQSKSDPVLDARFSHDMQSAYERLHREPNSARWEEEREIELESCSRTDFIPPKVMLISSKVPKAEYIPNIIRKDDPSIIAILYDHEHATFSDILDEIEKKLNEYRRGCKIWKLLIYCQGGPGYLYLLKNKVATFAKLEKEDDLIMFWKCLGSLMSKINTELNVVHIMGCYVLGNHNGEKLLDSLKSIMGPYRVSFESPLELSAQGKKMIETYFSFRLYKLWKARQHSKLVDDFDEIL